MQNIIVNVCCVLICPFSPLNFIFKVIGVAQVINKKSDNYEFTEKDVEV